MICEFAGSERSRTYWTPPMDRFLIDLMLVQVRGGNRIGRSFISQAWNDMVELFNANFSSHHDKEVLKNRYKHFRKQYDDVKILLQHNGFSWDEDREMVIADDHVWDAYIKVTIILIFTFCLQFCSAISYVNFFCRPIQMPAHIELKLYPAITNYASYMDKISVMVHTAICLIA